MAGAADRINASTLLDANLEAGRAGGDASQHRGRMEPLAPSRYCARRRPRPVEAFPAISPVIAYGVWSKRGVVDPG